MKRKPRASTRTISFGEMTLTISEWAAHLEMKRSTLTWRLSRGWSPQFALTEPVRPKRDRHAKR